MRAVAVNDNEGLALLDSLAALGYRLFISDCSHNIDPNVVEQCYKTQTNVQPVNQSNTTFSVLQYFVCPLYCISTLSSGSLQRLCDLDASTPPI
jgi:hypothetical protein